MQAADATAKRIVKDHPVSDVPSRVDHMFKLIVNDTPTSSERSAVAAYLRQLESSLQASGSSDAEQAALAMACHALFASSRFQFLE